MRPLHLLVLLAVACGGGSTPARRSAATPAAVPQRADFFAGLDSSLRAARQGGAQIFAPTRYAEALAAYRRADEAHRSALRADRLRGLVSEARGAADLAAKRSREVRTALEPALAARHAAASLDAPSIAAEKFGEGEERYAEAIREGEKGSAGPLRASAQRAAQDYREAARDAMEQGALARLRRHLETNRRAMNRDTYNDMSRRLERATRMARRADDRNADMAQVTTSVHAALDSVAGLGRQAAARPAIVGISEPILNINYDDPNATGYQPNVVTRVASKGNPYWMNYAPAMTLRLTFADTAHTWHPAAPFTIRWTVTTSAPLDHVDLRVMKWDGGDVRVAHYIERPNAEGQFPTSTSWDPNNDRTRGDRTYMSYTVEAVAVDQLGRASSIACAEANVRFGEAGGAFALEPIPGFSCFGGGSYGAFGGGWDLPPDTLEITYYVTRTGDTVTSYRPSELVLYATVGTITVVNHDVRTHRLRSVYTPPYPENPLIASLAIGRVAPLDFGTLNPGESRTLDIPVGALHNYRWTLYDFLDPTPYHRMVEMRIYSP